MSRHYRSQAQLGGDFTYFGQAALDAEELFNIADGFRKGHAADKAALDPVVHLTTGMMNLSRLTQQALRQTVWREPAEPAVWLLLSDPSATGEGWAGQASPEP